MAFLSPLEFSLVIEVDNNLSIKVPDKGRIGNEAFQEMVAKLLVTSVQGKGSIKFWQRNNMKIFAILNWASNTIVLIISNCSIDG